VPSGIGTVRIKEKEDGTGTYLAVEDLRGLVSLVQMGVLEIHPWGSTVGDIEHPDRLIFDLDPDAGLGWERVVEAAFELKGVLAAIGLESFAKTTGGKGLHVVVPVRPRLDWDTAKAFTKAVVEAMAEAAPGRYTTNMAKRARHGRIFLDYLRNGRGATAVGAFSSRARTGAPVSVPVAWTEIEAGVRSDQFTVPTVPERMAGLARDPWSGFFGSRQTIPDKALRKLRP
jgi:bifunctional non-homologous end joining protein LigD